MNFRSLWLWIQIIFWIIVTIIIYPGYYSIRWVYQRIRGRDIWGDKLK